jgi:Fe-S cluster biogenesis protein NfuA
MNQAPNAVHKVSFEPTPNPHTLRFSTHQVFNEFSANFTSAQETTISPLARKLFGFPWCQAVYVGRDFVTVTKADWVQWEIIAEPLANLIEEHLNSGQPAVAPLSESSGTSAGDNAEVQRIKKILDEEIRPMVAQDGGDIVFSRFEHGIVYLHMQGSCAGCPSSTMTLKMGIEARLMEAVPAVKEVVAI